MGTQLEQFRDHCRRMAERLHKPECPSLKENQPYWSSWIPVYAEDGGVEAMRWAGPPPPAPTCDGCMSDDARVLFAQLAGEVDAYLAGDLELVPAAPTPDDTPLF